MAMTPAREMFAALLAQGLTQAAAYRRAYPNSCKWQAASVWNKACALAGTGEVSARVAELTAIAARANNVTTSRIMREYACLAFFDVRRLVDENGHPLPLHDLDEDTARAISGLEVVRVGNDDLGVGQVLKFKMVDKKGALDSLARILGMFREDNNQSRPITRVVLVPAKRDQQDPL